VAASARITRRTTPASTIEGTQEIPVVLDAKHAPASNTPQRSHRRRSRLALVGGVVAMLAAGGFVIARHPIASLADRLLNGTAASTSTPPSHPPTSHPVRHVEARTTARSRKPLGPLAAGPIRSVTARPLGACRPGRTCAVRVTITVRPGRSTRHLSWGLMTINRCTGRRRAFPGGTMMVSAGSSFAYDTSAVRVAARRSVDIVGVTRAPVRTVSRPFPVPAHRPSC